MTKHDATMKEDASRCQWRVNTTNETTGDEAGRREYRKWRASDMRVRPFAVALNGTCADTMTMSCATVRDFVIAAMTATNARDHETTRATLEVAAASSGSTSDGACAVSRHR